MPGLRFRTKLATAMSLVVVGVTGATIWLTQHRVQQSWQKLFDEQFRAQIAFFSERQVRRMEDVARRSRETSAQLIPLLEQENPDPKAVYETVSRYMGWLGRIMSFTPRRPGSGIAPRPGGRRDGGGGATGPVSAGDSPVPGPDIAPGRTVAAIRVIDRNGRFIHPPDAPPFNPLRRVRAASRIPRNPPPPANVLQPAAAPETPGSPAARDIINIREQETGYIVIGGAEGSAELQEFITTPVISGGEDDGAVVGALFVALPAGFRESELAMSQFSGLTELGMVSSGIWIDDRLYTGTIPVPIRAGIAERLSSAVDLEADPAGRFVVRGEDSDQQVFYKVLNPGSPFRRAVHVAAFSLRGLQQEQRNVIAWLAGFGGLALAGAMGLVWLISHGLTLPMKELLLGTQKIRGGEFDVEVPVRSDDEVGELAASFNEMARGLAAGRRYQTLLTQFADRGIVDELISREGGPGGRIVTATVLFCDIRGFTALTATMSPEEVIAMLNEHMGAMTQVVYSCGGVVDKFVGDMIMAVFGAVRSSGTDAVDAARCARGMLAARAALNAGGSGPAVGMDVGIGIATGKVVAGCMGSNERLSYTVLGDRVNLASRLCDAAGPGTILIDEDTKRALPDDGFSGSPDRLVLKGYADPVPVWALRVGSGEEASGVRTDQP